MATDAMAPEALNYSWPGPDFLEVKGNVIYHESTGSWSTLRLAKRIVWEFPLLNQKGKPVGYKAVLPRSLDKIKAMLAMVFEGKIPPPLMLFFYEAKDNGQN